MCAYSLETFFAEKETGSLVAVEPDARGKRAAVIHLAAEGGKCVTIQPVVVCVYGQTVL